MASPLGPTQTLVLLALDAVDEDEAPPTPAELADKVNHLARTAAPELRPHVDRHPCTPGAVLRSLTGLRRRGYAERQGTAIGGARCWTITSLGRDWLVWVASAAVAGGDDPEEVGP